MKSLTNRGIVELDGRKISVDIDKARRFFKA